MQKQVRGRRKLSLAQRLEEQDRRLKQLSFEGLPLSMQLKHQPKVNKDASNNRLTEDDVDAASNSLNSCPATHDDGDLLCPDSPMTHPPRTVTFRTGDLHEITMPRTKNSRYRKRLFSIDFSTICTEREETSLGEEEDLSEEEEDGSAASFGEEDYGEDGDDEGGEEEWKSSEAFSISTYPPRSIMLFRDHLDAIATPHRNRMTEATLI